MGDRIGTRLVNCERCGVAYNARERHRCAFKHLPDCQCDFVLIDEYCIARERVDAIDAARPSIEERARADERAKIVADLRQQAAALRVAGIAGGSSTLMAAADAIERNEHRKGGG